MNNRNYLGKKAERDFGAWCSSVGIVCNSSESEDLNGWDFIIEFNNKKNDNIPLDKRNDNIECKIQVKSTLKKNEVKFKIKVDNLLKLLNYSYPVFFIMIYYKNDDGKLIAKKAGIRHLDEELIKKVLRIVREAEKNSNIDKLHKKEITFSYNSDDILFNIDGMIIKKKILSYFPSGILKYIEDKKEIRLNCGSPTSKIGFSIENSKESFKSIQEHLLGYNENIKIKDVEFIDSRFDIDLLVKKENELFLSIGNPIKKVKIVGRETVADSGISFFWNYKSTSIVNDFLPSEYHSFILSYGFLKFYNKNNKLKLNINFCFNDLYSFSMMLNIFELLNRINNSYKNNNGIILDILINSNPNTIISNPIKLPFSDVSENLRLLKIVKKIFEIFMIEDMEVKLIDIVSIKSNLGEFNVILNTFGDLKITLNKDCVKANMDSYITIPVVVNAQIGDSMFILNTLVKGSPFKLYSNNDNLQIIECKNAEIIIIEKYKIEKGSNKKLKLKDLLYNAWHLSKDIDKNAFFYCPNQLYLDICKTFIK